MASKNVIITNGSASETLYNADKIEEKLATGRAITGNSSVSGNLTVGGTTTLTGATTLTGGVSGDLKVTALTSDSTEISAKKPVVELMTGYSYNAPETSEDLTKTPLYVGAVKNGNKLTLCVFMQVKKTANFTDPLTYFTLGNFSLPTAIYNKLSAFQVSGGYFLDVRKIHLFSSTNQSIESYAYIQKFNDLVRFTISNPPLVDDVTYIVRYEITFLLSNSLAA